MAMTEEEAKTVVGLTVEEAERQIEARGSHAVILWRDGVSFPITAKYDVERVGLHIEKGKVLGASVG